MIQRHDLRNIAIIAHVDHGKTTLVDGMLRQARVFHDRASVQVRVLDNNDLERERGITILAKNTAIHWGGVRINLVDTPGHADFGGEVERVLNMVDGVLLLVDAVEGPMPQTRFVLREALAKGHQAVVVVNKMDRANARPRWAVDRTFDLFVDLGATDEQAHFQVVYTNALTAQAGDEPEDLASDLTPLFESILKLPPPMADLDGSLQLLVSTLDYDPYRGRVAIGRLSSGSVSPGQLVVFGQPDTASVQGRVGDVFLFENLTRAAVEVATAGEIVAVTGMENVSIGDTVMDPEDPRPLPPISVEEPTVRMAFLVNSSPFSGREGEYVSSRVLRDRLLRELERNVALRVEDTESPEEFLVSGRGELHLAILIETMRREGYEFAVGRPEVITRESKDGVLEPFEDVYLDVGEQHVGPVIELLGTRRGSLLAMEPSGVDDLVSLHYLVPMRGLLGLRNKLLTATKGTVLLHSLFHGFLPWAGSIGGRESGSLVAHETGITNSNALNEAEGRGVLFVGPREEVYAGQVVGEGGRSGDIVINVCRKKHLTNHRKTGAEEGIFLRLPVVMGVDEAIEHIGEDELVEVTPKSVRIRKRDLEHERRQKAVKRLRKEAELVV